MPVGQAVIAMSVLGCSALGASAGFAAASAGFAGAAAAGAGFTTPSTRPTTSSGVDALRSDSTKSLRTRARARLDSSFMCSAPPDSGAAIRKARSAGPSGAPKSTAGFRRAKPIEAVSTYGDRQCGMAMPPGSPVADWASRAIAAATSPSASVVRPASASRPDEPADHRFLVGAGVHIEQHQVGVDDRLRGGRAGHGATFGLVVTNWLE